MLEKKIKVVYEDGSNVLVKFGLLLSEDDIFISIHEEKENKENSDSDD